LILGNAKQVTEQVLEYHRLFGDRLHFVLRLEYPGQAPARGERAIQLWGQVAKSVRNQLSHAPRA